MNFNKSLLDRINNFVKLSGNFDENYKLVATTQNNTPSQNVKIIYTLTQLYIQMRIEHGKILLMMDELKDSIISNKNNKSKNKNGDENNSDDETSKLYDLSTFNSIIASVNELLNNIDLQYKRIATTFPTYIDKKPTSILLLTLTEDENDKFVEMIRKLEREHPEHIYKIVKCKKNDKKFKCDEELDITLKITKLPTLFVMDSSNITEIPLDNFNDVDVLKNIIK